MHKKGSWSKIENTMTPVTLGHKCLANALGYEKSADKLFNNNNNSYL